MTLSWNISGEDEFSYLNRHHRHSINVCAVSGPDLQFYYLNANYGGRSHDSRVLRCSSLWHSFEVQRQRPFPGAVLLADSGYPLRDWILTPFPDPDPDQARYNRSHIRTRNSVERAFGLWKKRFYCLALGLRVRDMALCTKIITCCAILHNTKWGLWWWFAGSPSECLQSDLRQPHWKYQFRSRTTRRSSSWQKAKWDFGSLHPSCKSFIIWKLLPSKEMQKWSLYVIWNKFNLNLKVYLNFTNNGCLCLYVVFYKLKLNIEITWRWFHHFCTD